MAFDALVIFPQENKFATEQNPFIVELRKDIHDIRELIKNGKMQQV